MFLNNPGAIVMDKASFASSIKQHAARMAHLDKRAQQILEQKAEVLRHLDEQLEFLATERGALEKRHTALQALHETL